MIKYIPIIFLFLTSCVTLPKCEEKFGECGRVHNTHTIEYRDTTFYIKGETIYDTLAFWQRDTIRITDSTGRLTAEIGRIRDTKTHYIRITSKPDTIHIERVKTIIKEGSVKYVSKDVIPFWIWLIIGGLSLGLLASLFRR
jgi:hypothetical protein